VPQAQQTFNATRLRGNSQRSLGPMKQGIRSYPNVQCTEVMESNVTMNANLATRLLSC